MKVIIVGGVAGGMSAATRLRRQLPTAEIIVFERGAHVSYANCGLPYHVGAVIPDRGALLLQTPKTLRTRFDIDVRVRTQVLAVDPHAHHVRVRDLGDGREYTETYDRLVLSTGATALIPDVPGASRALVLRSVEDADRLTAAVTAGARTAVIAGGGFIGLEVAENLAHRGLSVTVVERDPQVLAPLDPEMAAPVAAELAANAVQLRLGTALAKVLPDAVELAGGETLGADLVLMAVGVRPEAGLARAAGLTIGPRGGIVVDESMRTSDPDVFAVGDVAEKPDAIGGDHTLIPLAGIANRQGRLVADAIAGHRVRLAGRLATAIVQVFGLTVAVTGWNEKRLRAAGRPYRTVHTHPTSHAGYFPGSEPMSLKLLFDPADGTILGAQAVGGAGVDKRIDVIATAMRGGLTACDLADLELCYAPQFGSAKDPVNMLGYIAGNVLNGSEKTLQWYELTGTAATVIDVRTLAEHAAGHIPGSINIPLDELRDRMTRLPDGDLVVYCQVGQRGHTAAALLAGHGRTVANLDGGYRTWSAAHSD
jgi:NADPH-dependent 2,4-dienoyl-CoA reductase/sulfur reductase-like enzyme/rhodanese-related sulfurtransferase